MRDKFTVFELAGDASQSKVNIIRLCHLWCRTKG